MSAPSLRATLRWCLSGTVLIAIAIFLLVKLQSGPISGAGEIRFSGMNLAHDDAQLQLKANAQVSLPPTVQAGLDNGVPLTFVLELNVVEPRRWLPDRHLITFERRYKLTYYELTRHYRVDVEGSDNSRNYRSLASALSGLGQLGSISIELNAKQRQQFTLPGLEGTLAMRLSKSALPLPLQPIFRSSWTLVSEEYRWPVT